ncbi:hypothetical protein [Lentimonas sp. CC10]|uniref:hypothetical protein n=1 Tax=Lentimonas sp. CC10 TaxID=2676095 RepID=UPI0013218F56|nr:hypothetical protein [Lentimonas sp. CC10]CAA6692650.1 Unannotated [Lentimonas sp. CC19]CAA6696987.1 Unannotated [Lentimonas sp. CC10]CAA7071011.1 Unannotated [Lentimonas sp. CC11]
MQQSLSSDASRLSTPVATHGYQDHSLAGKRIVAIGGRPRPPAILNIRRDLKLSAVDWVPTRESKPSGSVYVSRINQAKPDIVVLLIGLMRHQQASDLRNFCRKRGIPCVTLHRSLSAAQLSHAWLSQCYSA